MTNTPKLAIAIGYIDNDLVTGAVEYMPAPSKKFTHIWKHFVAVAACMVIVFGISGTHNYLKQYVATNDIQVYYADTTEDRMLTLRRQKKWLKQTICITSSLRRTWNGTVAVFMILKMTSLWLA